MMEDCLVKKGGTEWEGVGQFDDREDFVLTVSQLFGVLSPVNDTL